MTYMLWLLPIPLWQRLLRKNIQKVPNPGYAPDFGEGDGIDEGDNDPSGNYSVCWTTLTGNGMSMEQASAMALALVLDKYNAGVVVLKQNSDGSFSKLGTIQTESNGDANYTQNNCP